MLRGEYDPHAMQCHAVAPERTGRHVYFHRKFLTSVCGWPQFFGWYRVYHVPNGRVGFNLGNIIGYQPDRKYIYDERVRLEDWDLDRLVREIEFQAKCRAQSIVIMEEREQRRFGMLVGLGKYCDINVRIYGILSIWLNLMDWKEPFWALPGLWAAYCHFIFIRYYMSDPSYRYQRLFDSPDGTWQAMGLERTMNTYYWAHAHKPVVHVLGPNFYMKRRMIFHRILLILAGTLAFLRYAAPKMCCIPCDYVPRAPYPSHPDGTSYGYWLQTPGTNPMGLASTKALNERTVFKYIMDAKAGYIGFLVCLYGVLKIF